MRGSSALEALEEVKKNWKVDEKRTYLTGISDGAFAVWRMAAEHPVQFAAIVPIGQGADPKLSDKIKHIPCWCFQPTVKYDPSTSYYHPRKARSREMIEALQSAGATPKYEECDGSIRNCWQKAYARTDLYDWLLDQKLK